MAEGKKGTPQGKKTAGQKANGQTTQTQPKKEQQKKPVAAAAAATSVAVTPAATKAPAAPKAQPKVAEKRKREETTDGAPAEKKAKGAQGQAVKKGKQDKKGKKEEKVEEAVAEVPVEKKKRQKPRRCLTLGSRGMIAMERYLMNDLRSLMPHHKVESKLEKKHDPGEDLMEMAELKHCDHVLYLENRKRKDTYMYLGEAPNGPTAKFLCRAIHTMAELKMTGNCIKGSRPFLHFDGDFDTVPHLKLLKPLITNIFGIQQHHPNSKPFIDHIFCFFHLDGRVWFRNYQIVEERISKKEVKRSLLEVGPRFAIEPIRILSGPFVGHTLYKNEAFQSPNAFRAEQRKKAEERAREREAQKAAGVEVADEDEDEGAEGAESDEE